VSNYQYYRVDLVGLLPGLLLSNGQMADPTCEYAMKLKSLSVKKAGSDEAERQRVQLHVTGRLYLNADERVVIPEPMISKALQEGCKAVNPQKWRKLWAGITVLDHAVLESPSLPEGYDYKELYKNPECVHRCVARDAKKQPQPRYRPLFKRWKASVLVEIDPLTLDEKQLRQAFEQTGKVSGFGDWRPSSPKSPGKFGRFVVANVAAIMNPMEEPEPAATGKRAA
jgi:hypothetical protein